MKILCFYFEKKYSELHISYLFHQIFYDGVNLRFCWPNFLLGTEINIEGSNRLHATFIYTTGNLISFLRALSYPHYPIYYLVVLLLYKVKKVFYGGLYPVRKLVTKGKTSDHLKFQTLPLAFNFSIDYQTLSYC